MSRKSAVSIVKVTDSINEGVETALHLIDALPISISPGTRVLLKPNIMRAETASVGTTTNIEVIRSVAELFRRQGANVVIGEASGNQYDTEAIYSLLRVRDQLADFEVRDLDQDRIIPVEIKGAKALRKVGIAESAYNADFIVSLPVMKTHNSTLMTGGMKNMMGVLPQREKWNMHLSGLHQALVDLNRIVKPHLVVMDAIVAMEGWGPGMGYPVGMNLILASTDVVAIDAVASAIMGIEVREVEYLSLAGDQDIGISDLSQIEVHGERIETVRRPFRRPPGRKAFEIYGKAQYTVGRFLLNRFDYDIRPFLRETSLFHLPKPKLHHKRCTGCGDCVSLCPEDAISMSSSRTIDYAKCTRCMLCYDACTDGAILISRLPMWLLKLRNFYYSRLRNM